MNIYVLNTLSMGTDSINILKGDLRIKGIIGLTKRESTASISGYAYLEDYCKENGFDFIPVEDYSLKDSRDKERLLNLDIDILIVCGWQRLIPEWLINHCKICAIGAHGSAHGITKGRGRSPQNWALLLGKKKFYVSIFRIDAGIDSGEIIETRFYTLNEHDDIQTSYFKATWLTAKMIIENILNGNIQKGRTVTQFGTPQYLPQRLPEDGKIDWKRKTEQLYNFIRAQTKPYPGAYTEFSNYKCYIWRSIPFDDLAGFSIYQPGQIIKIFSNKTFLVKTGNGTLLILDYSIEPNAGKQVLKEGMIFESAIFKEQMNAIIERHYQKYPEANISDDIMNLSKNG